MKCCFCEKIIEKYKIFHTLSGVKKVCGQCYSIHKLLRGQTRDSILRIINAMDDHTCYTCKNFRNDRERHCKRGKNTGINMYTHNYPFTYANHGCATFVAKNSSI